MKYNIFGLVWLIWCFIAIFLIYFFVISCESEKKYQFKMNDGFSIFCKKYVENDDYYSVSDCCVMDNRQRMLVEHGNKKSELRHIIIHPQSW